jgi:S1-C subfamily serine protease
MIERSINSPYDENGDAVSYATKAVAVTTSDSTVIARTRGIYVGGAGNIAVTMADGGDVTFTAIGVGTIHQIGVVKIKATGTTATNILALY